MLVLSLSSADMALGKAVSYKSSDVWPQPWLPTKRKLSMMRRGGMGGGDGLTRLRLRLSSPPSRLATGPRLPAPPPSSSSSSSPRRPLPSAVAGRLKAADSFLPREGVAARRKLSAVVGRRCGGGCSRGSGSRVAFISRSEKRVRPVAIS